MLTCCYYYIGNECSVQSAVAAKTISNDVNMFDSHFFNIFLLIWLIVSYHVLLHSVPLYSKVILVQHCAVKYRMVYVCMSPTVCSFFSACLMVPTL
jgi:hypothetical protein